MKYCPKCQRLYPTAQRFCPEDGGPLTLTDPYELVGRILNNEYCVESLVGVGGVGAVYRAHHFVSSRRVALKVLRPDLAPGDQRAGIVFEQEAERAGRLAHEHVAEVIEVGRTADGLVYLATEWLDGRTLEDELSEEGPLDFERTAELLRQMAAALDAAHAIGVIHRGFKPSNVLLVPRPGGGEQVKVLDFGLAKVASEVAASPIAAVPGTPHYASPEQFQPQAQLDERSDIYSLGAVLYRMLTGVPPFNASSARELARMQLTNTSPPLRRLRPEAPEAVEQLVSRLLSKYPDQRPSRAGEVAALFDQALNLPTHPPLEDPQVLVTSHLPERQDSVPEERCSAPSIGPPDHSPPPEPLPPAPTESAALVEAEQPAPEIAAPVILPPPPPKPADAKMGAPKRVRRSRLAVWSALGLIGILLLIFGVLYLSPAKLGGIDSVAVLPLLNASDQQAEYLADGVTEGLIRSLSRLPGLKVTARTSAFRYKGREPDPQAIGRELDVRTVLIGRLDQRGNEVALSAELIDARDKRRLWARQYAQKSAEILVMQEDLVREVATRLRPGLSNEELGRVTRRSTDNAEAYRLYLQGRHHLRQGTSQGLQQGVEYFMQAVSKDPRYGLPYAGLAEFYFILGPLGVGLTPAPEAMPKQREAAVKAIELDDTLAEAHTLLGMVKATYDWDWPGAEREYKRALDLSPGDAAAHQWYGTSLTSKGQMDEALAEIKRALALDPFSFEVSTALAAHYFYARQYDRAVTQYRATLEFNQNLFAPHAGLAQVYEQQGLYREALAEVNEAIALSERSPELVATLGRIYAALGQKEEALKVLGELNGKAATGSAYHVALLYAALGERDQAFARLDRAYQERSPHLSNLKVEPGFDPLRSDDRLTALLRRLGLMP